MGYEYVPIKQIRVKNYMVIGDVTIDFIDSPIIVLSGDNEAGKSSIIKAFTTVSANKWVKDRAGFIRDGSSGYGIEIKLENDYAVSMLKTNTVNRYEIRNNKGEKVWESVKSENEIPLEVLKIMGIYEEPETGELIQIRTFEDALLFVSTPTSTNYKVMYNELGIKDIPDAVIRGTEEINELRMKISNKTSNIESDIKKIDELYIVDTSTLEKILERVKNTDKMIVKSGREIKNLEHVNEIGRYIKKMSEIKKTKLLDNSEIIKIERVINSIDRIKEYEKRIGILKDVNNTSEVNIDVSRKIMNIANNYKKINKLSREIGVYRGIEGVKGVDYRIINKINSVISNQMKNDSALYMIDMYKEISHTNKISNNNIEKIINISNMMRNRAILRNQIDKLKRDIKKYEEESNINMDNYIECANCGQFININNKRCDNERG